MFTGETAIPLKCKQEHEDSNVNSKSFCGSTAESSFHILLDAAIKSQDD